MKLKKEGRIKKNTSSQNTDDNNKPGSVEPSIEKLRRQREKMASNPVMDQYRDKISQKLGKKEKLLTNLSTKNISGSDDENDDGYNDEPSLPSSNVDDQIDNDNLEDDEDEMEILEAVERALAAKRKLETAVESKPRIVDEMEELVKQMETEQKLKSEQGQRESDKDGQRKNDRAKVEKTTSGVGGSWAEDESSKNEIYRPANGGWGYFPRPKDISKAYGGGRKIGADVKSTYEDELRKQRAIEETREKLKRYREKVGIEVQSEKDHADEIEEALAIGQRAMQRGVYGAAVSALEKVTKWCSTNSKVGGQVFLELVRGRSKMLKLLYPYS